MSLINLQLQDVQFRFVSTKLELTDDVGAIVTTVLVKQLQTKKIYLDLNTGETSEHGWEVVPEITSEDAEEMETEDWTPEEEQSLLHEEQTVNRIEQAIHPENSA